MPASAINAQVKRSAKTKSKFSPKRMKTIKLRVAVSSSIAGYCQEIEAEQFAHLPRSQRKLRSGIFCNAVIWLLHFAQRERGTDRLNFCSVNSGVLPRAEWASSCQARSSIFGNLYMTTLRKLPITRPKAVITAPQKNKFDGSR